MKKLLVGVVISTTMSPLGGCGGSFDVYSSNQIHRTVQSRGAGHYVVDYRWREVAEQHGNDRATAVPKYLEANRLVPTECSRGVIVIRGGEVEGDGGWAEFRCAE